MTIRLLTTRDFNGESIPAGAVVSVFDAITEAALILAKVATASSAVVTWTPTNRIYNPELQVLSDSSGQFTENGGVRAPASGPGNLVAAPDSIVHIDSKFICSLTSPAQAPGNTGITGSLTNERPRPPVAVYRRKMTATANTQCEYRFGVGSNILIPANTDDFTINVYIEDIWDTAIQSPNNPYISFVLSNGTSAGADYRQYTFGAGSLVQGENVFRFRKADVNNTKTAGNMDNDSSFADTGTGYNWAADGRYISVQMRNMSGGTIHVGDIRTPTKAKPIIVIGFDANQSIIIDKVAPLLAKFGVKGYVTWCVYEKESFGGTSWQNAKLLEERFGWENINHTVSHGATSVGRYQSIACVRTANVVVGTIANHGIPLNRLFKTRIESAPTPDMNGVFDAYAPTANTVQWTAPGSNVSESAIIRTALSDVLNTDTPENRRIATYEIGGNESMMRTFGLNRRSGGLVWPNNSVPHIDITRDVCNKFGIFVARGARKGYTSLDDLGIPEPLHCGTQDFDSGNGSYTRLSGMKAKVAGQIERGVIGFYYGHFLQPKAEAGGPVTPDFPPGQGGNPAPPAGALSGGGGWWYYEDFEEWFMTSVVPAIQSGQAVCMTPSQLSRYLGLNRAA